MTNEQVQADIAANLPDNTSGLITPAKLRTEMGKMVDYSDTSSAAAVAGHDGYAGAHGLDIDRATTTRIGSGEAISFNRWSMVSPGAVKREQRTRATAQPLEVVSGSVVAISNAGASGLIVAVDIATGKTLYTYDGATLVARHTFPEKVATFKELAYGDSTSWVCITIPVSGTGTVIYTSFDTGATWEVTGEYVDAAPPAPSQCNWSSGEKMLFGEYFDNAAGRFGRIFLTLDAGQTWTVHQLTTVNGGHFHWAENLTTTADSWLICFGDGTYARLLKLEYADGVFTETVIPSSAELHFLSRMDTGRWLKTEEYISVFDPVTFTESRRACLRTESAGGKVPYSYPAYGWQAAFSYRGIYYACFMAYGVSEHNGLYASADDGETWTCVYKSATDGTNGVWYGWGLGDYLYLIPYTKTKGLIRISADVGLVSTIRCDAKITNRIASSAMSTFSTETGVAAGVGTLNLCWGDDSRYEDAGALTPALIEVVAGGYDGSGHQLHVKTKTAATAGQYNVVTSPHLSVLCAGRMPVAGDYYMATCRVRSPNASKYIFYLSLRGLPGADEFHESHEMIGPEWTELRCYGRWVGAPVANWDRLWVVAINPSSDQATNVSFDYYIDAVRLFVSSTPKWILNNRNGIIGQQTSDEVVAIDYQEPAQSLAFEVSGKATIEDPTGNIATVLCLGGKMLTISQSGDTYSISDGTVSAEFGTYHVAAMDTMRVSLAFSGGVVSVTSRLNNGALATVVTAIKAKGARELRLGGGISANFAVVSQQAP